jgi:hypothetical protein
MARPRVHSITTLDQSPADERRSRVLKYTVAMSVRMVCFVAIFFLPGWWRLAPAIGVIVLPYVAVVIANTVVRRPSQALEAPAGVVVLHESSARDRGGDR